MNLNQQSHFPFVPPKRKLSSVISSLIACGVILVICLACAGSHSDYKNTSSSSPVTSSPEVISSTPVVDIPKLIRQSPKVFEKAFGKATEAFETDDPGTVPGEI